MNKNVCKGVSLLLVVVAVVFAILGFSANNKYKDCLLYTSPSPRD